MKVLAVVGSPRAKGNTEILVSKIAEGTRAAGAEVETLYLRELAVAECDGCHACWQGHNCSKGDDMLDVYEEIAASDVIVFGTPVYWYGPTALMKAFVDRFVSFNCEDNRRKVRRKKAAVAVVMEEESYETARLVVEFFEKSLAYLEMEPAETIVVGGVGARGDILDKQERLAEAYEMGRRLG